jgi:hypothetical protein
MAKKRKNNYREVETLPKNAMTVAEFEKESGCSNAYAYTAWKRNVVPEQEKEGGNPEKAMKKIGFEIVVFKGINFIIPKGKKKVVAE